MKNNLSEKKFIKLFVTLMDAMGATTERAFSASESIPAMDERVISTDLGPLHITLFIHEQWGRHPWIAMKFENVADIRHRMFSNKDVFVNDAYLYGLSYNLHSGKWNLMLNKQGSLGKYRYLLYSRFIQQLAAVLPPLAADHPVQVEINRLQAEGE